jgi:gliding motility-associated-like protein
MPYQYANLAGSFTTTATVIGVAGTYNAIIQDANGCTSNQNVTINNVTVPLNGGTFGPYETCDEEPIEIVAFGGDSYSWTEGSAIISSIANPIVNPTQTTLYYVTIAFGTCSMVDSVLVSISLSCDSLFNNTVINTNAFSPNGDGVNDVVTFDIPNLLQDNDNKVYFINRWGDVIREYDNYNNVDVAWDGKSINGVDLPEGTYFYIIEIPSQDYKASGWIQLIRNNSNN